MPPTVDPQHVTFVRGPIVCARGALNNEATPSMALACLSAWLHRHGFRTTWVDAIADGLNRLWPLPRHPGFVAHGLTPAEVVGRIPAGTSVVAFSGMFSGEWPLLRELVVAARARHPDALFVIGGEHATALSEYCLRDAPALDACVRGEGERPLLALLEALRAGRGPEGLPGVAYLDRDGVYREGPPAPRIRDLGELSWPHWPDGYLERFWVAGKSFGVSTARDMPFLVSRGCPYRCTFCSNRSMWTQRYVLRDPDDCVAELEAHVRRYRITSFQLYDPTAVTRKSWILAFCRRLVERGLGLSWSLPAGTRSEALDAESLGWMRRSGVRYVVYAPESASPSTLASVRKQVDLPRLEASVREAMRLGIVVRTNLVIGFPGESRIAMLRTLAWGLRMAVEGVDEVPVFLFNPYPGSELFEQLRAAGRIRVDDAWLLSLNSLNGRFVSLDAVSHNGTMGERELWLWRTLAMGLNYAAAYGTRPARIVRTLRSLLSPDSSTVLEHRLKDALRRRIERPPQGGE